MKRIVKVIGLLIFSAFLLLPLKTNAQEAVWSSELNLSDSISSSIVKVEDGLIVMQYEGTASTNNLLIKYDFDGNKVWEINNEYGYNIEAVSDGFIVWSIHSITKFDKDKNIIWTKNTNEYILGSSLIEVDDGYITYDTYKNSSEHYFVKFDFDGNVSKQISAESLLDEYTGNGAYVFAATKMLDGKGIVVFVKSRLYRECFNTDLVFYNSALEFQRIEKDNVCDERAYNSFMDVTGITATNNGYIVSGKKTLLFDKNGKLTKVYNIITSDIKQVGDNIYAWVVKEDENNYTTGLVKYDQDFNELYLIKLPLSFYSDILSLEDMSTGFSRIKHRVAYYNDDNNVDGIVLNTPIVTHYIIYNGVEMYTAGSSFTNSNGTVTGVAKYRLSEGKNDNVEDEDNNNSGIIDNIIKNPETNSIILTIVVLLIILTVSIVSYRVYKNKITINNKSEKEDR